jgi:hypothetical protein
MLIHRSPQVDSPPVHAEEHLIHVPRPPAACLSASKLLGKEHPELDGPASHRLVRDPGRSPRLGSDVGGSGQGGQAWERSVVW